MLKKRFYLYGVLSLLAAGTLVGIWILNPATVTRDEHGDRDATRGLGYLSGYEEMPEQTGVTVHESGAQKGLNLYVSGDGPIARLVDMEGGVVHRWRVPWDKAFPNREPELKIARPSNRMGLRKFNVYPNGDLLVIFSNLGLVKVDRHSNVKWSKLNYAHHDLWRNGDRIYVLTRSPRVLSVAGRKFVGLDDVIKVYSSAGRLLEEHSIAEALLNSRYRGLLTLIGEDYDFFHTNSLEILPDTGLPDPWRGGDALLSINKFATVAVMDFDREKIIWTMTGRTGTQHDATYLRNGRFLVFDNGHIREQSRVLEVEPEEQRVTWVWSRPGFYSYCCGTNQRLKSDHTLITESTAGRVAEITADGDLVWEFVNPHRDHQDAEKIAKISEMKRYRLEYFTFLSEKQGTFQK